MNSPSNSAPNTLRRDLARWWTHRQPHRVALARVGAALSRTRPGWKPAAILAAALGLLALAVGVLAGAVALVYALLGWLLGVTVDLGQWVTEWPITQTITDPVRAYLDAHAANLPATADQLWWAWAITTAVLLVLAWSGSVGARIGWTLTGACTAAMVYAGTAPDARALAAGITVMAWATLSILAFQGTRRRPAVEITNVLPHTPDPTGHTASAA